MWLQDGEKEQQEEDILPPSGALDGTDHLGYDAGAGTGFPLLGEFLKNFEI